MDTGRLIALAETQEIVIVVKQLRDHHIGARFDLPLQILQVGFRIGCFLVRFRIASDRYAILRELVANQRDQFIGILEPVFGCLKGILSARRVAAEGDDIIDADPLCLEQIFTQLVDA